MKLLLTLIFSMLFSAVPAGAGESSPPTGLTMEARAFADRESF